MSELQRGPRPERRTYEERTTSRQPSDYIPVAAFGQCQMCGTELRGRRSNLCSACATSWRKEQQMRKGREQANQRAREERAARQQQEQEAWRAKQRELRAAQQEEQDRRAREYRESIAGPDPKDQDWQATMLLLQAGEALLRGEITEEEFNAL